ncbi:MAG: nucleoside 2-deoxyribosyltransferase [Defluviitaleaceae bacterium]|nr:nucleoside 2-deoxyribosyltransferase [Defluviitaleaceae bacterium]
MVTSAILQEKILELISDGEIYSVQKIKAYLEEVGVGEYSEGQFSGSMNTLLRNGTVKKAERGMYSLVQKEEEIYMKKCFVVSPIGNEGSEVRKNADTLFKYIILPVCESCGFIAERVDHMNDAGSITDKILESLEVADLVIADVSGQNPNVFYEMGFRKRTGKPIIHLRGQGETLPFDISAIRALEYNLTDLDSVESTKDRLEQTINAFSYEATSEDNVNTNESETSTASILPILFDIVDGISDLKMEVNKNNNNALQTVIETLQKTQPKMSQEDALMAQLIPAMLEKPEMLNQLIELGDKFPQQQGFKKSRR